MKTVGIQPVAIDAVEVPQRLRDVDHDWAEALALSIRQTGLQQPIQVAFKGHKKGYRLLAGAHRLEACRILDHDKIMAVVLQVDGLEARLVEIDENLIRHELNPLDRAAFLAERKAVWEEMHPEAGRGGDRRSAAFLDQNESDSFWSFSRETAEKIGVSQRTVELAVRIHARLSPEARKRIAGTWIATKQGQLLALARHGPDVQAELLDMLLAAESPARSVAAAVKVMNGAGEQPEEDLQLQRLMNAWNRAGRKARGTFLAHIKAAGAL